MSNGRKRVALISTGGTIEKVYDELQGTMVNQTSVLEQLLAKLNLRGVEPEIIRLMNKDSLDMTEDDHTHIASTALECSATFDGVVIVHGTDRLATTGERIFANGEPKSPIILTGAMRPFEMHNTDALQNITESLLAVQLVEPGVYVAMHNNVLRFPGIVKDYEKRTFVVQSKD